MTLKMGLWLVAVIFLFLVFSPAESSMIKLIDGGYEDIVIAIHPGLPENVKIIEKIKDMLNEATHYLFNATQNRLFIRSAKILLPMTWTKGNYSKRKTETYDKADVIVANPYLKYGEDPYTLQYGSCGEPARYIHFTPNFLLDDNLLSVYGPRGRVFVHEWAHLRWGVYDEYNLEKSYYVSTDLKVEATRCSRDIFGVNVKRTDQCQGSSCKVGLWSFDQNTGLYEEGCMFLPDKNQIAKQSIMYLQALPSVSEFCNSSNHNIEAPTLQNRMCNSQSTWDIIRNSIDINSTEPMENTSIPLPSISVIQFKDKVVTLVLDVSGSMNGDRIARLYQAAEIFVIQNLEAGSYVGIVTFQSSATIKTPLLQIKSDLDREKLKSLLPKTAYGGTNICLGILAGIEVNKGLDNSSHGTDIILLSDGEDNYDPTRCFPNIYESGVVISFINLGPNWVKSLKDVIEQTGGSQYSASENLDANGLIDAFTGISIGNGDLSQQSIQLESTASILNTTDCLNGSVFIDRTVGINTFFVVTWQTTALTINLEDPNGKIYTQANFTSDTTSKSSRLAIPGTADIGQWDYSLCNTLASNQALGVIVSSKAADVNLPPITVNTHMNTVTNAYPNPMIVYAAVSQGLLPVKGANVTAIIEPASGTSETLELLDNGAGVDIMKNDGVYSRYFTAFKINGRYNLKVRVQGMKGKSRLAVRSSRAFYVPGYVDNGVVTLNPPRPEVDDDDLNLGEFSRIASGGAFDVSNIPSNIPQDIYKPDKITDLYGTIRDGSIILSWTATGDDLDQGTATSYYLRMSTSPKDLRDNFYGSSSVNMFGHTPLPAGSTETFTFEPENIVIANGTILYFALVATDKTSQNSDISNIAQAALFIPPTPAPTAAEPWSTQDTVTTSKQLPPNSNKIDVTAVTAIEMVKEASVYLFCATENRLSIKDVKILIPSTWSSKNNYVARTRETYEKADVIISDPFLKNGDSPYTVQYRGCGEQGEHIHLTPNYLLNTSLSSVYGPPGRTFIHEWAHLRWGVFDEFSDEIPYYISRDLKVEATRCSASIKGNYTMQECKEDFCSLRDCNIDSNTGLYEQGCLFLPEKVQSVQESIMYYSGLPSITFFCNDSSHNIEAPSLQNRMCNCHSTWDIIMKSTDITSTSPRPDSNLLVPSITLIQSKRRVITLACDVSKSMESSDRIVRLFQGAEFFLTQIVETGSYVGIVEFSFLARVNSKLVQVNNEEDRKKLISLVPLTIENDSGNICQGILEAINVNKALDGSAAGSEILLATDGELYYTKCIGDITASGAVIHILALGSDISKGLEAFVNMTGGQAHFVTDVPSANDMFNAFSAISNQNGDVTQQPILLESRSANLESEGCLNGTIFIDSTVGTSTFFLVTWQAAVPSIYLQDPNGNTYIEAQFTNNTRSKSSRLQVLGKAEIGAWNYTLCNRLQSHQVVGIIVTSKAGAEDVPPITVKVHMNKDTNDYPEPMIIYTSVHQGLLPVTNLHVTASVKAESGNTVTVQLLDNGAGADVFKNDGVYSRYFTSFSENGRYNLIVHVESQETETRLALPKHRALYIPGYMENGGESMNPPKPSFDENDLHITGGRISRTASGGSFIVNNVPTTPQVISHKPCKILDLEANAQGDSIVLSWTATGDNLDKGKAVQYDLRISTNPRDLRDSLKHSAPVNISSLTPKLFGSLETFTFVPNNMTENDVIVLYFALTVINKDNQESDISNIAQTAIRVRTTTESSTVLSETTHGSTGYQTDPTDTTDTTTLSPTTGNSIRPSTSLNIPTENTDPTVFSTLSTLSKTIPPTIFPTPPNNYTATTTDNSAILTHITTGNTSTVSASASTTSSSPTNINVTAIVIIVCVTAVVICIIICVTVYFARFSRTGKYSATVA